MVQERIEIPNDVIDALRCVEEQRLGELEMYDRENVILFTHVVGRESACDWLRTHRELYFEALRRADAPGAITHRFSDD